VRQNLLEFHNPIFHKTDPPTSREAAAGHESKRQTDAALVLDAVRALPGRTSTELARELPLTLYAVRRRLTDLMHKNLVRQGEPVARGGERKQIVWWTMA